MIKATVYRCRDCHVVYAPPLSTEEDGPAFGYECTVWRMVHSERTWTDSLQKCGGALEEIEVTP